MKDKHRGFVFLGWKPVLCALNPDLQEGLKQLRGAGPLSAGFISFACMTMKQSFPQQDNASGSSSLGPMPVVLTQFASVLLPAACVRDWQVRVWRE